MARSTTNFFFNNWNSSQEQTLLEDLIIESVRIHGHDVYYLPRKYVNKDEVYGADPVSEYDQAFMIAMYLDSFTGFKGDGNFMSKFGIEMRDQVIWTVPQRTFRDEIGNITGQPRPNEGDIIFFTQNGRSFQIKYVEKYEMLYQLGKLYTWKITCELFEYSNEKFNTGIPDIDSIEIRMGTNILDWGIKDELGNFLTDEDGSYIDLEMAQTDGTLPGDDSDEIQRESNTFVDFSEIDPFSEGNV